jgi:RNA polymerase sigma factor (sigma-70 family)
MSVDDQAQPIDSLLKPFLQATDQTESQHRLEDLVSTFADPIIRRIIQHKLHLFFNRAGERGQEQEAEDVYGDVIVQLLGRLREFKFNPSENAIGNFRSYVAVITYNVCYESLRHKYPQRHSLKNKLRYLLTNQQSFTLWENEDNQWLCGFRTWQERTKIEPIQRLLDSPEALAQAGLTNDAARRLNLAELLAAIFNWAGAPVELDEVVNVVAQLRGIREKIESHASSEDEEELGDLKEQLPDPRVDVAAEVDQRMYLERLWSEICQLPPRQRTALLLNLRDAEGRDVIALLPITGTASVRQIAQTLEIPAEQFAALWNDLPLDDATLARHLGITRQQVINLRKSARQRLARRMKGF